MFFSPLYLRNDKRLNCEGARVMGYTEDQKYGSLGLASCCDSGPPPPPGRSGALLGTSPGQELELH